MKFKKLLSIVLSLCFISIMIFGHNVNAATVKLNNTKLSISAGETYQLKLTGNTKKVTWSSKDKKIVTVSSKGKIKGIKAGQTTIIAKVNKNQYKCIVTVKESVITKTAEDIVNEFIKSNLTVGNVIVYDENTDPNNKLGRPNQYTSKSSFSDTRLEQETYEGADPVGGTIEVFANSDDAKARYDYIYGVTHGSMFEQYMYLNKNVLLRLDYSLTPTQASEYESIFNKLK